MFGVFVVTGDAMVKPQEEPCFVAAWRERIAELLKRQFVAGGGEYSEEGQRTDSPARPV